jgi:hypothetical protein
MASGGRLSQNAHDPATDMATAAANFAGRSAPLCVRNPAG